MFNVARGSLNIAMTTKSFELLYFNHTFIKQNLYLKHENTTKSTIVQPNKKILSKDYITEGKTKI